MKTASGKHVPDPTTVFDLSPRTILAAVNSPHAPRLAKSLCDCSGVSCRCPNMALEARAVLALLPPDQVTLLVERYGLKVEDDEPLSREEARAALGPDKFYQVRRWIQQFMPAPTPATNEPLQAIPV